MSSKTSRSILEYTSYREFLRDYVRDARNNSRSWSYTSWSRKLDLASKSSLVMIVQGARNPGPVLMTKLGAYFNFKTSEMQHFRHLVAAEKKTLDPVSRLSFVRAQGSVNDIEPENKLWLSLLLLDLVETVGFIESPRWIKERILVPVEETAISLALEQLLSRKLLRRQADGRLVRDHEQLEAQSATLFGPEELGRFHQMGSLASHEAFLKAPRDAREFRTSILRISPDQLPEAQKILTDTQRKLSRLLQTIEGDAVYELHLHLFPLTKTQGFKTET